ncbi:MAG: hypothetical protein DCF26_14040 [Burkholderiales bacterium]|nr:MAG: hypothetical protein DCF26_14040 [Burkholderiales bacterium]
MHATPTFVMRVQRPCWAFAVALSLLGGCASLSNDDGDDADDAAQHAVLEAEAAELSGSGWAQTSQLVGGGAAGTWVHRRYGNNKPTRYLPTVHEGRLAVHAQSDAGNSTLRLRLPPEGAPAPSRLAFSWFVPALNERVDLRDQDIDDAVARVIVTFGGDRDRLSVRDNMLSELANLVTGEPLPFATLMYVWDHRYPVGSVIPNPHTQRIRMLVIDSGPARLNQWVDHERDIQADYRLVFGESPGPVSAVGVMTDSNNTGERVSAWFGPLVLSPLSPANAKVASE